MAAPAKPIAATAPAKMPTLSAFNSGRATTKTPKKPNAAILSFLTVNFSPRKKGARRTTQIGEVNSNANNCASGIKGNAKNHKFCPMK